MINIDYSNHEIRVTTEKVSSILETPLTLKIISQVSHRDVWTSQLNDGWWASFPTNEINDVEIFDKNGFTTFMYNIEPPILVDKPHQIEEVLNGQIGRAHV